MDNKIKSTTKQILLDMMVACPSHCKEIEDLLKSLTDEDFQDTDNQYRLHQYTDHSIRFVQSSNLNACPHLSTLLYAHPTAHHILHLMIERMCKDGTVSMQVYKSKTKKTQGNSVQELLQLRPTTIRNEIQTLIECGFIALYKKAAGHDPAIYAINPQVAKIGNKSITESAFWNLTTDSAYKTFNEMSKECKEYLVSSSEKDTAGYTHSTSRYTADAPTLEPFSHDPSYYEIKEQL